VSLLIRTNTIAIVMTSTIIVKSDGAAVRYTTSIRANTASILAAAAACGGGGG
jgi:hypothetical protein